MFRRNVAALLCLLLCVCAVPVRRAFAQTAAPVLVAEGGTDNAVAVEPVPRAGEPFLLTQPPAFSTDTRTRVMLFAQNVALLPGETASALTATAEDAAHNVYPLTGEGVDPGPGVEGVGCVGGGWSRAGLAGRRRAPARGPSPARARPPPPGRAESLTGKRLFPADNP